MAKILVVDDDPVSRKLIAKVLDKAEKGYAVVEADSGEKALELVPKEAPSLILLDVLMPNMDGFEVCKKLKADAKNNQIPVLFITSLDKTTDLVTAFRAGAADYITKPINADEVKARVASQLALRKAEEARVEAEGLRTLKGTVAALNHNMNQPLMTAYTYLNIAFAKMEDGDVNRKTFEKIKAELDKLNQILGKIRALEAVKTTEYVGDTEMLDLDYKKDK